MRSHKMSEKYTFAEFIAELMSSKPTKNKHIKKLKQNKQLVKKIINEIDPKLNEKLSIKEIKLLLD